MFKTFWGAFVFVWENKPIINKGKTGKISGDGERFSRVKEEYYGKKSNAENETFVYDAYFS